MSESTPIDDGKRPEHVQAVLDAIKAAKSREQTVAARLEAMQTAQTRAADPMFQALASELKKSKGEHIEAQQKKKFEMAQSDIIKAAQAKIDARAKVAEDYKVAESRRQDQSFLKLSAELGAKVAEKEQKANNNAAWEEIKSRQADEKLSQLVNALKEDNKAKLKHIVASTEDAEAALKKKLAAAIESEKQAAALESSPQ